MRPRALVWNFSKLSARRVGAGKFTGLDVGTGSGILAIALALLGASDIRAIDNDPVAVKVAAENLHINRVVGKSSSKRDQARLDQTDFHGGGRQPHRGDDWRTCRRTAKTSSARRISHFVGNLVSESERHRWSFRGKISPPGAPAQAGMGDLAAATKRLNPHGAFFSS